WDGGTAGQDHARGSDGKPGRLALLAGPPRRTALSRRPGCSGRGRTLVALEVVALRPTVSGPAARHAGRALVKAPIPGRGCDAVRLAGNRILGRRGREGSVEVVWR